MYSCLSGFLSKPLHCEIMLTLNILFSELRSHYYPHTEIQKLIVNDSYTAIHPKTSL